MERLNRVLNNHTEQDGEPTPQVETVEIRVFRPHTQSALIWERESCMEKGREKIMP